jgi:DNA-binding response OmpR family regulator
MARLLVIEDEPALAAALSRGLRAELYVVDVEHDGDAGLRAARAGLHDLLLLDLMLPGCSGLEICRTLRAEGHELPILMLTARDTTADVVAGLDAGAHDYLCKPFAFDELLARVRALLRGRRAAPAAQTVGDLRVDLAGRRVWRAGRELTLTPKEFQLLEYLLLHLDEVVPKERLLEALYEEDCAPDSNVLEVHVAGLRRKVDRDAAERLIHTVRRAGYVLRSPG